MTSEERFWELVNREVDQELTPSEEQELENCLANHPQWAIRRAELAELTKIMSGSEEGEVPADMKGNILKALPGRTSHRSAVMVFRPSIRGIWSGLGLRYVYAFSGGAVVGACLIALVIRTGPATFPIDNGNLTGTIVLGSLNDKLTKVNRMTIDQGIASGSIDVAVSDQLVVMRLELVSDLPVELTVEFEQDAMVMTGFNRSGNDDTPIAIGEHGVGLTHTGTVRYDLIWTKIGTDSTTIRVKLLADELIYDQKLVIPLRGT
jgi:hypothetical protein